MSIGMLVLYFVIGYLVIFLGGVLVCVIKDLNVKEIVSIILGVIFFLTVPTVVGYIVYMIITYFIG